MGGKHQAYQDYKNSNIGWMGAVPSHWKIVPCRSVVKNLVDKNEGAKDQNYLSLMANVGVILYDDKGDVGNKKPDDLSKCKIVKKGNLVINSMNYAIGSYGMSAYDGVCSPVYIVLDTNSELIEQRFALRLFENSTFQKYLATFGNGILEHRAAIGWDDIKGAYIPLPTKIEQQAILNFLDHETAKIDTLIAKQQQLIALLKEKRQAVIRHAVTKGLNPNAPMRDSGVEWLGEVPAHWTVINMDYALNDIGDLDHYMPQSVDKGIPYVMTGDLKDMVSSINFEACKQVSSYDYTKLSNRIQTSKGDVIMARYATVGTVSYVDIDAEFLVSYSCVTIKPNLGKVQGLYLYYYFKSDAFLQGIQSQVNTNTQGNVGINDLKKIKVALPTLSEQSKIVEDLQLKISELDRVTEISQSAIALAHERRTALISAAVTGKIDVRDWQAPESIAQVEQQVSA